MQLTPDNLFYFNILLCIGYIILMPLSLLIFNALTPKYLLEHYFKEPHFLFWETAAYTGFPGIFVRTIMFITVCTFPKMGKKRKMTDIRDYAPSWYIATSKFMFLLIFGVGFLIIFLLLGLGIEAYIRTS